MGVAPRFGVSSSVYDRAPLVRLVGCTPVREVIREVPVYRERILPNPDPKNYRIKRTSRFGKNSGLGSFMAVEVNYPDCTNYEGNKVLVYEDARLIDLNRQGSLDPHFSENKNFKSPIARFEPTKRGWEMARRFCILMGNLS